MDSAIQHTGTVYGELERDATKVCLLGWMRLSDTNEATDCLYLVVSVHDGTDKGLKRTCYQPKIDGRVRWTLPKIRVSRADYRPYSTHQSACLFFH